MMTKDKPTLVHIFTRSHQRATRSSIDLGDFRVIDDLAIRIYIPDVHWLRTRPRALVWARCCRRLRQARFCTVQNYYDDRPFWCRKGRGCKA